MKRSVIEAKVGDGRGPDPVSPCKAKGRACSFVLDEMGNHLRFSHRKVK